jgi:HK97 family phage major capsid protein/HK97 family phage prohead protease
MMKGNMMEQRKFDIEKLLQQKSRHRAIEVPVSELKIDKEARTVELSVSSEYVGLRRDWWEDYYEQLMHGAGNVNLDRLNNKASLLYNHKPDMLIGVVEKAWLDAAEKKVRAVIRFSKDVDGEKRWQQVLEGVLSKVSIGYDYYAINRVEDLGEIPVLQITDWEIFEISMVTIPFDDTVGVGRSKEEGLFPGFIAGVKDLLEKGRENEQNSSEKTDITITRKDSDMDEKEKQEMIDQAMERGGAAEVARCTELVALHEGHEFDLPKAISEKRSVEDVMKEVLKRMQSKTAAGEIGMTKEETKRFSMIRLVRALANPYSKKAQEEAAFELEACRAVESTVSKERTRQHDNSIFLPHEVQSRQMRANTITTGGQGAGAVPEVHVPSSFIEFLRNELLLPKLGATVMDNLTGVLQIPKQTTGSAVGWVAEDGTIGKTDATFINVPFSAKYAAGYIEITRAMLMNNDLAVENIIMTDLALAFAEAINTAFFEGDGEDNSPTGILNMDGVQTVVAAAMNIQRFLEMQEKLSTAKIGNTNTAYVLTSALLYQAMGKLRDAGVSGYLIEKDILAGKPVFEGLGISGDHAIYGKFINMVVGNWGPVEIWTNPYQSDKANIQLWGYAGTNIMCRRPTGFVVAKNASLA